MEKTRKRSLITMLVLLAVMLAGCLLIFHNYMFGNDVMVYGGVGSDTKQQYIMWYNGIVNRLRAGDLAAWDFHNGMGISQLENNLTAPFNLLIYLLGTLLGPEHIAGAMVYVQILKVLLCGLFAYLFLSEYGLREDAKLIASFLYAFNGYLMVWGQHYMMGSVLVFLPLLLWAIERTILSARGVFPDPYDIDEEKEKSSRGKYICPAAFAVALVSAVIILSGYYQGYMVMLGFGIYVTIRVLLYENTRMADRLKLFGTIALFMVLGVAMGCVGLLPQVKALSASSRLSSNASIFSKIIANFSFWEREYYRTIVYRFFGNNLQGTGNAFLGYGNYYEAANLCFSALFVLLFLQYLALIPRQQRNGRQKLAQLLGVLVGLFILCVQLGSLIFNGFAYAFSRQTFLFMPFFAMITAWSLHEILQKRKISWTALIVGCVMCVAVYGKAYVNYAEGDYETNALILLLCSLAMVWALFQIGRKKLDQPMLVRVLSVAVFISVVTDTSLGYRNRDTVKKTDNNYFAETYHGDTTKALEWIHENDDGFYRIEKDYSNAGYYMESLAQNYRGISTYNSTLNANVFRFISTFWPQLLTGYDLNHFTYRNTVHDTVMAELTGVRYLLTKSDDLSLPGYELVHQEGNVYVYRNSNAENIASFYEHTMSEAEYRKLDGTIDVWDFLPEVVVLDQDSPDTDLTAIEEEAYLETAVKGILDTAKLGLKNYHMLDDGASVDGAGTITLPLSPDGMAQYQHMTAEFDLTTDGATTIYIYTNDDREYEYFNSGKVHYRLDVPMDTEAIRIEVAGGGNAMTVSGLNFYGSTSQRAFSDAAQITISEPKRDSRVTGHVSASKAGIVMLAIPWQEGWSAYVDGEKQPLMRADFGLIAVRMPQGEHELTLQFKAPLLKASVVISLAACAVWIFGLIACLILTFVYRRRKKKAAAQGSTAGETQPGEAPTDGMSGAEGGTPAEGMPGAEGAAPTGGMPGEEAGAPAGGMPGAEGAVPADGMPGEEAGPLADGMPGAEDAAPAGGMPGEEAEIPSGVTADGGQADETSDWEGTKSADETPAWESTEPAGESSEWETGESADESSAWETAEPVNEMTDPEAGAPAEANEPDAGEDVFRIHEPDAGEDVFRTHEPDAGEDVFKTHERPAGEDIFGTHAQDSGEEPMRNPFEFCTRS